MLNNANRANGYTEVYYNFRSDKFFTDATGSQFQELNITLDGGGGGGDIPDDLIKLTDLSVSTGAASGGGSLSYDNTTGVFSYAPADTADFITLTDLTVSTATPSGAGSLSYSNTTGVFSYAPSEEISKSIQVVSSLPTTGLSFGDVCALTTDNSPYFYDGTAWRRFYLYDAPLPDVPDTDWDSVLLRLPFNDSAVDVKNGVTPSAAGGWSLVGAPVKYGSGSLRLQGGDFILYEIEMAFLDAEFTIEYWIYFDEFGGSPSETPSSIFTKTQTYFVYKCSGNTSTEDVTFGTINYANSSEELYYPSVSLDAKTWYHLAYVRNGTNGQMTLYINGVSQGTISGNEFEDSSTYDVIFSDEIGNGIDVFIDDVRISDIARYTSDFTPPSTELPTS